MEQKFFQKDDVVISQGQKADAAYLVENGEVHVYLNKNGKVVTLARLGPGSIFGETALFGENVYGAHVEAAEDNTILRVITPESFRNKIEDCDPTIKTILMMLVDRLRKTNEALVDSETREFIEIAFV